VRERRGSASVKRTKRERESTGAKYIYIKSNTNTNKQKKLTGLAQSRRVRGAKGEAEVGHGDGEGVEDGSVESVLLKVDEVHLLADLLKGSLGAERSKIRADVAVRLAGDLLEVDVVSELHVLGVDAENLQAACGVGDADVDLAIEAAEAAEGGVNAGWMGGRG
jgi:hypothetical protein